MSCKDCIVLRDEITALRAELEKKKARLKQWEEEDVHEAMACYISHKQMDAMKAENASLRTALEEGLEIVQDYVPGFTVWIESTTNLLKKEK